MHVVGLEHAVQVPLGTVWHISSQPFVASPSVSKLFAAHVTAVQVLESKQLVQTPKSTVGHATQVGSPVTWSPSEADDAHVIVLLCETYPTSHLTVQLVSELVLS